VKARKGLLPHESSVAMCIPGIDILPCTHVRAQRFDVAQSCSLAKRVVRKAVEDHHLLEVAVCDRRHQPPADQPVARHHAAYHCLPCCPIAEEACADCVCLCSQRAGDEARHEEEEEVAKQGSPHFSLWCFGAFIYTHIEGHNPPHS
jgi:hypothetical protein